MAITVCHFPPGTSKWNKIEHRLFSYISANRRGRPLVSLAVIVSLIGATRTATGLRVRCELDRGVYPRGQAVSDAQMAALHLVPHRFHGDWNYTLIRVVHDDDSFTYVLTMPNVHGHQPGRATRAPVWWTAELGRPAAKGILFGMTRALDAAIAKLAGLPPEEQDRIARWLLDELEDEDLWARQFATSQEALSKLAAEARADRAAGRATDLDPDKL